MDEDVNKLFSEAFNFSEGDIAENQDGKLSEAQKTRLFIRYFFSWHFWSGLILGLPVLILGLWLFGSNNNLNMFVKLLVVLFGFFFIFIATLQLILILLDINAGQVTIKQTRIQLLEQISLGTSSYSIGLSDHRGEVTKSYGITAKQYELLNQKVNFRVNLYIAPRSEIIVAMEKS